MFKLTQYIITIDITAQSKLDFPEFEEAEHRSITVVYTTLITKSPNLGRHFL